MSVYPRTQIIGSPERGHRGMYRDMWGLYKGPRTQIIGFQGPNTIICVVFGPGIWSLKPYYFGPWTLSVGLEVFWSYAIKRQ